MLSGILENVSRKILASDPVTQTKLVKIAGKTIAIELLKINQCVYLSVKPDYIDIHFDAPEQVDVRLIAKPSTLLKITKDGLENAKLESGELVIEGDAIVGQQFARLMNELDIDWEELFSELIGDIPARALFSVFEKINVLQQNSRQSMQQNLSDYLIEESGLFAHPNQIEDFINAVDELRNDVSRFEARLSQINN